MHVNFVNLPLFQGKNGVKSTIHVDHVTDLYYVLSSFKLRCKVKWKIHVVKELLSILSFH